MTVHVVVADDQAAIRTGLVMILSSAPDVDVVGEAGDGLAAVRLATDLAADLVLMDIRMPVMDGIEATRQIVADGHAEVLVLTTFDIDDYVDAALAAGVAGSCSRRWRRPGCSARCAQWPAATVCSPPRSPAVSSPGSPRPHIGPHRPPGSTS